MKKIFTLTLALAIFLSSFAQKGTRITGSVIDGSQKTVESSTITLLRAKDSTTVKLSVANKEGVYSFEDIAQGKYLVSVSAMGHEKGFSEVFDIKNGTESYQVNTINLIPVAKTMGTVTVVARKPLVEQKIDRTVVNVDASVTNVGTSALEVLEKSPGVTVDKDGNISLKGKEGVMVMIDGRPTQLGGTDLANLLKNMNSNQLDQIEIMTNPPARFDAAGNAGVINIKTKKNKQAGYNGSLSLGYTQGFYPKYNEGFNFNYREGKVNLFTNLSHNYRGNWQQMTIQRNLRNTSTKVIENYFDQTANMNMEANSYNAKLGMDYFASKNTTVGFVFNGFSSPLEFHNRNVTLISNQAGELENITKATVDNNNRWKNFSTNLNFRTVLDTTGKELTADVDYMGYNSRNSQYMVNSYFNQQNHATKPADTLVGALPQNINIYSGRMDYTHPLKKGARFEAGIKTSFVKTDNNARYDSILNGNVVNDVRRTNHFIYEENINAAYVNLSTPLSKKISSQLGLRLENTHAKGNQITTGQAFDRNYTQLFPTAYFQYKANDKNNIGLNYGRRIRRPNYESLNPFVRFLDRYTYNEGNPELRPQFSHNIELSHTYKNFLTTTVNYNATNDIIQQVIEQKGEEAYAKQANIAKLRQVGLAVNANMPLNKWWTNSIYLNVYSNRFEGIVNNEPVSFTASTFVMNGSEQFKISKTFTAELSGFYRTAGLEGVVKIKPMGMLNVGFSQQILKNQGSLRLSVRDVFQSGWFSAESKYGNVDARFQEKRDSRQYSLAFTYRFSKGKMSNIKKKNTGSASEEQNRVGVGNN